MTAINTIALAGYDGPVLLKITYIKPDGTRNPTLREDHTQGGVVYIPTHDTDTIEARAYGPGLKPLSPLFTFEAAPKQTKEYATEESLNAWGYDGVYSEPEQVRRDLWDDELLTRDVTEWRKANE